MASLPAHESSRASANVSRTGRGGNSTGSRCTKRTKSASEIVW